jgi:hypothetical protein
MTDRTIRIFLIIGLVVLLILDARVHYRGALRRAQGD